MLEFRVFWTKWRLDIVPVYYDEDWIGLWVFYLGPFCLAYHKMPR